MHTRILAVAIATCCFASTAFAQAPDLVIVPEIVSPAATAVATITGPPGQNFALVGSATGHGLSHGGVPLGVGPDFTIISIGRLDGSGQATATVSPPFLGTTLDRYYVQAVVSPSASFIPLQAGPVRILKNADLVAGLAGLSRVASVEHSADVRLPNVGPVVVAQITVLAPRSGSVLLNASGSFEMLELGAGTAATCSLTTGETVERPYSAYAKESPFSNTYQYVPFGGTRIFGVTAGTSTTFRLVCAGFGVTVVSPVLTALFVAGS